MSSYIITEEEVIALVQAVYDMRQAQRRYFTQQIDYNLKVAMAKESQVDKVVDRYAKAGLILTETKKQPQEQGTLFNS